MTDELATEGWKTVRLRELAEVFAGGTPSTQDPRYWGGDQVWVTPTDLTGSRSVVVTDSARKITEQALKESSARLAPRGSILVTSRATIGATAIAGLDVALNQGVTALVPNDQVDRRWLYYWVRSVKDEMEALASGTTFKEISRSKMREMEVALPSLAEQRRVADLLSVLDAVVEAAHAEVECAATALAALRDAAFDANKFEPRTLGSFLDAIEGGRSLATLERPPVEGERAVLKVSAIQPANFVSAESKALPAEAEMPVKALVKKGDILITRANTAALVGAVCQVEAEVSNLYLSDKTLRLYFAEGVDSRLFIHALSTASVRAQLALAATGTSASMKNISQDKIRALLVAVPGTAAAQRAARETLDEALEVLRRARETTTTVERLRRQLIRLLVTGEHRISPSYDSLLEISEDAPSEEPELVSA